MGNKVLVVGATGLVGSEVVKALLERGVPVKAASRKGTEIPGAEATIFDLGQPATFASALAEVDRVFLLAPAETLTVADKLVLPFVDTLKDVGVRKIVFMTHMTAYQPDTPLHTIEKSVKKSGIAYTLLKPNWFDQNFAPGFWALRQRSSRTCSRSTILCGTASAPSSQGTLRQCSVVRQSRLRSILKTTQSC